MNTEFKINTASECDIFTHLYHCNNQFVPALSTRVSLEEYAKKIADNATLFEVWVNEKLIGLVAMYLNEHNIGYITNVSVYKEYSGKGIAKKIFIILIDYSKLNGIIQIKLEVNSTNVAAINLYKSFGFQYITTKNDQIIMLKNL